MFRVLKLNDFTGLDIDQVVMRAVLGRFITGTPTAEVAALQNTLFLEQPDCAVNRCNRDMLIERGGPPIKLFDVRMIAGL